MQITVAQHIFSNVPKDQSPSRKRGYQTLFYTRAALSREDVLRLEEHALFYGDVSAPAKLQFWILGQQAVVAHTVPLLEPDEFGRTGRYLTHSLILSPADFQHLESAPWPIVQAEPFFTDLRPVYAQGNMQTGDFPPLTLSVNPDEWEQQALQHARTLSAAALIEWARCGWQAATLRRERRAVALEGDAAAVRRALAVACALCPVEKRPALTFDTYAAGCDWRRAHWPFWVWAGLSADASRAELRVAASDAALSGLRLDAAHDSPVERWIAQVAAPAGLPQFRERMRAAGQLESGLNGNPIDLALIDPAVGREFARLNAATIARHVVQRLPVALSPGAQNALEQAVQGDLWPAWQWSATRPSRQAAHRRLVQWLQLGEVQTAVTPSDWAALSELAERVGDIPRALQWALNGGDEVRWQRLAAGLPGSHYEAIAQDAVASGRLTAEAALAAPHLELWAQQCGPYLQPGAIKHVLKRIEKEPALTEQADGLVWLVDRLARGDRALLTKWAGKRAHTVPNLVAQLAAVAAAEKQAAGHWSDRLRFWKRR